ncbi:MAG: SAM-dependent methyltransferase [Arcobacteraceae bacterium]|jgi:precorrin-4 methylase|nr:SAM-dependent methyltransferase [Arcobacteraceae bacterium]
MLRDLKKITISVALATLMAGTNLLADGKLSLVSSGTGDLDNMTIKAYNTIKEADIVFTMGGKAGKFEELVKGKPIYDAGHGMFRQKSKEDNEKAKNEKPKVEEKKDEKAKGEQRERKSPEEIAKQENEYRSIIRDGIKNGKNIVIIDNGDPTIYGPHIGFVKEFKDLNPKIIPGMSSFNAANAALQTAVIGGDKNASGVTLTIGSADNKLINKLADTGSTMVFFMDRKFSDFMANLQKLYPKDTPIAIVIEAGSADKERVILGTVDTMEGIIGTEKIPFNHLVYVGNFLK